MPHETTTECTQSTTIARLQIAAENTSVTVSDMKHTLDKLVELLSAVAKQDSRLNHLEDHQEKAFQDVQNLYGRMRDAELVIAAGGLSKLRESVDELSEKVTAALSKIGKFNTLLRWTTGKYALAAYGVLLAMLIISFIGTMLYHKDFVMGIYHFWKG